MSLHTRRRGQIRGQELDESKLSPTVIALLQTQLRPGRPNRANFQRVDFLETEFRRTNNPVHVWEAIAGCADEPLPDWVRDYLLKVAVRIGELTRQKSVPRRDAIAQAIARATGFISGKGRRNYLKSAFDLGHELFIAGSVYMRHTELWADNRQDQKRNWRGIFQDVAERHTNCFTCGARKLNWKTVEKYWRRHALAVIPPHLVARSESRKIADILR